MVLAASGVEHEELLKIAEPLLSDLPSIRPPEEPKSVYVGGDYRCQAELGKTHFALAFEAPGGWHKEKEAVVLTVLQMLMGGGGSFSAGGPGKGMYSRLYLRVLSKYPQIHSFSAFNSIYNHTGLFGIHATTELHRAIKLSERALVLADPIVTSLGNFQQAHVFTSEAGDCAAFLSNYDTKSVTRVMFNNMHYNLPPWSISILPDCRNVVFNTAKVEVQTSQMEMLPSNAEMFSWDTYNEDISSLDDSLAFSSVGLLEQINVTRDASDYLWYITR